MSKIDSKDAPFVPRHETCEEQRQRPLSSAQPASGVSERVERLRTQIAAGEYKVEAEEVAEKLMARMMRRGKTDSD